MGYGKVDILENCHRFEAEGAVKNRMIMAWAGTALSIVRCRSVSHYERKADLHMQAVINLPPSMYRIARYRY